MISVGFQISILFPPLHAILAARPEFPLPDPIYYVYQKNQKLIDFQRCSDPSHQGERGVIEPLLRGNRMENGTRMATPKQMAYIESLSMANGVTVDRAADLTMAEASELIGGLLQKADNGRPRR
jgi:hypothetical protein